MKGKGGGSGVYECGSVKGVERGRGKGEGGSEEIRGGFG